MNAAMMLNTALFDGTGGWVLKPKGYLPVEGKQPKPEKITCDLSIKILAAQGLGHEDDVPNAYVKSELHIDSQPAGETQIPNGGKSKGGQRKYRTATRHSRNPDFGGELVQFSNIQKVVPELSFLRYVLLLLLSLIHIITSTSRSRCPCSMELVPPQDIVVHSYDGKARQMSHTTHWSGDNNLLEHIQVRCAV